MKGERNLNEEFDMNYRKLIIPGVLLVGSYAAMFICITFNSKEVPDIDKIGRAHV
jgi:hypothetical protein